MKKENLIIKVLQSPFEQAFVKVYNYLVAPGRWMDFNKFRHKRDLLDQLGLPQNNIGHYVNATRNIPDSYHQRIIDVLVNEYGISHKFITTNTGPMFLTAPNLVNEDAAAYGMLTEKEFAALRKGHGDCMEENARLKELIDTQKALIKELRGKSGKKSGK